MFQKLNYTNGEREINKLTSSIKKTYSHLSGSIRTLKELLV